MFINESPRNAEGSLENEWWYDPNTGQLGIGPSYGEGTVNGKVLGAIYGAENVNSYLAGVWNRKGRFEVETTVDGALS